MNRVGPIHPGTGGVRSLAALFIAVSLLGVAVAPMSPAAVAEVPAGEPEIARGGTLHVVVPAGTTATPSAFQEGAATFLDAQIDLASTIGTWELSRCCLASLSQFLSL